MGERIYQVLYIDKFKEPADSEVVSQNLRRLFGLSASAIRSLASGQVMVVKRNVPEEVAQKLQQAIADAGGTAWIEEMELGLPYQDRREDGRRALIDRRDQYRASTIQPDRRQNLGRRGADSKTSY